MQKKVTATTSSTSSINSVITREQMFKLLLDELYYCKNQRRFVDQIKILFCKTCKHTFIANKIFWKSVAANVKSNK